MTTGKMSPPEVTGAVTDSADKSGRRRSRSVRALVLILAWAALTGLLIAAGVGVTHSSSVNAFDRHVTSVVVAHRIPALNAVMKAVTWLGSWVALVATGILLVVLASRWPPWFWQSSPGRGRTAA